VPDYKNHSTVDAQEVLGGYNRACSMLMNGSTRFAIRAVINFVLAGNGLIAFQGVLNICLSQFLTRYAEVIEISLQPRRDRRVELTLFGEEAARNC
jgi:hypothetical protein